MPSDYGYINARVKGLHARLLPAAAFEEILGQPGFPAFAKWIEAGPYGADWQLARARSDGLDAVEWALESNFSAVTARLLAMSEAAPHRLIALLLRRWDLANLKTLIRGIALEWGGHEIVRNLWPAGALDLVRLRELAEQATVRAVADILASWQDPFARPLSDCLPAFEQGKDLIVVDVSLDRFYYREAFRQLRGVGHNKGLLREIFKREVDLANAKAVKRLGGRPDAAAGDPMRYFIEGGAVFGRAAFAGLLDPRRRKPELRRLRATPYYAFLTGDGDPVALEAALDQAFWAGCARLYRADPLGIDVTVGYLWQKYYELVNLRLLARAAFYGLPPGQVRPQLFLP